jgi:hypothetical protein
MKTMIIVGALIGVFFLFQAFISRGMKDTETQAYRLIKDYKTFEIRFYPSSTLASIKSDAHSYRELSSPGFRKLAGYIFGGNADEKQIAMTSPVHMALGDSGSSMSFVMPSAYTLESLPKPLNSEVSLSQTPSEFVAAITFGGYITDAKIEENKSLLQEELNKHSIKHFSNFRVLGYNPPYQVIGRRNELIVTVDSTDYKLQP